MSRAELLLAATFASLGIGYPGLAPMPVKLIWNASASAPVGLYAIDTGGPFEAGDLVATNAPEPLAALFAERGYLPEGVPLMKRIMAVPGQIVCRVNRTITVDGVELGAALERDRAGRDLPVWQGCRRVERDEVFLMNRYPPHSLDGRYFGLTPTVDVIGRAFPLWTDEDAAGRYGGRAPAR